MKRSILIGFALAGPLRARMRMWLILISIEAAAIKFTI